MTRQEAAQILTIQKPSRGTKEKIEAYDMAIKALQEPRWIPVSERLPEKQGAYLVTIKQGNECYRDTAIYNSLYKHGFNVSGVIAWMPLPKPYESQESEG